MAKKATLTTNETINNLISEWKKAKDAEKQWTEYRQGLEDHMMTLLKDEVKPITAEIDASTSLSKTLGLGDLDVQLGYELKVQKDAMNSFVSQYPMMVGPMLRPEYVPIASKGILETLKTKTEMAQALALAFEKKEKRPYFSVSK